MAAGDPYSAVGGTFTCPISSIKLNAGTVEKDTLKLSNITGPGDSGAVTWMAGNYRYGFTGRGTYIEGASASTTLDEATTGTLTVALGSGESWTGDAIITRIASSPDWGPGGDIGVVFSAVWTGSVTISNS